MRSTAISCLRYRDGPRAIDVLCRVLGFQAQLVVPGENGSIAHAQLVLGGGMVMLGSVGNGSEYGKLVRQPDEIGGFETQSVYVVVGDADAVLARAEVEGWTVVIPIRDEGYGGRGFSVRDHEGRLWNIGTYDPWSTHGDAGL
ncbi:VOC family protein [Piscinibacter koreensis]|uniref:Glyoxalase n=1 Tax=Piscinibacter koreensis TaxID=2742824 RepID=A0A7Y6NTJ1_9BURK|nr:VOC family protein [Schlegelella koreensis]NUZ09061.1 glyoxalase [Schlegelella koreensis]